MRLEDLNWMDVEHYLESDDRLMMVLGSCEQHGYLSLPLLVRPNTILPVGANEQKPDYEFAQGVTFHIFELQEGTLSVSVPTMKGEVGMTLEVSRSGQEIHLRAAAPGGAGLGQWQVLLRGLPGVQALQGCTVQADALGSLLLPLGGAQELVVKVA